MISEVLPWTKSYLSWGPLLTLEAGSWNVSWTMENQNMSLAKDMYPGARLERWRCNMLPRTCVLLWGQTAWVMPLNHSMWTQEGGLPAPACSRLGQICKACFACQNLGLSELVFLLFSPDSFLSKQLRKKKKVENNSLKKGDCVSTAGVPIMGQMLGKKKVQMDQGQAAATVVSCLPSADKLLFPKKKSSPEPSAHRFRNFTKPLKWYAEFYDNVPFLGRYP